MMFQNIRIAFPEKSKFWQEKTAKNSYHFFINQTIQFLAFPNTYLDSTITVIGKDILDKLLNKNNGLIFVSGHFGAWEILAAWLGQNNYPVTAVATKQTNRGSDKFFLEQRSLFGMKHIYRKESLDNMYKVLEEKGILALVSDQDAKKRGVFVDFFNRKASTPKGAARFHLKSKAPIIFTICYQTTPNKFNIEFILIETNSNSTIESITQSYTLILEQYVHQYPEQYFWFHRRWKTHSG